MSISSAGKNLGRKALDPMFICMVGAMVLAVGSSLLLRAVAGPRPARAADETAIPAANQPHGQTHVAAVPEN